jgi:hypothetical protein
MGKIVIEMFHENRIALDREILEHPKLMELLKNQPHDEFEMRLAQIAAYCSVVLHGDYLQKDLDDLCGVLHKKLYEKRSLIILTSSDFNLDKRH